MPFELQSIRVGVRFFVVNLLPNTLFVSVIGLLMAAGAPAHRPSFQVLSNRLTDLPLAGIVLLVVGVSLFSIAVYPLNYQLAQLIEGYWLSLPFLGSLREAAIDAEWRRREYLQSLLLDGRKMNVSSSMVEAAHEQIQWIPGQRELVLPTAFGNAMRVGETLAGERYGMNTKVMWPRLVRLLPEEDRSQVVDLRNQLDATLRLSVIALLLVPLTVVMLLPYDVWLLVPLGAYLFAWMCYRAAVAGARRFCQALAVMFDLHHLELWDRLSLNRPRDIDAERATAKLLSNFLAGRQIAQVSSILVYKRDPGPAERE